MQRIEKVWYSFWAAVAIWFAASLPSFAGPMNWGDFQDANQTEYLYFDTSEATGINGTLTSGALAAYENGSATQFTSGLTLDNDFDSVVGFNQVACAFSDSNFEDGKTYTLILTAGTVDGVDVTGKIVGVFSVGRYANVATDADGKVDVRSLPNIWFVDDGGNDSNDGKTVSTPKLTIAAAVTAASPGDTVYIGPGTYSGALSTSKHNLTFIGDSSAATTITHNSGYTWTLTGNHCTLRNLTIAASAETSSGTALNVSSTIGTTIDQCVIDGKFDGLLSTSAEKLTITRSKIKGTYDAANFNTVRQLHCEDVDFLSTADHSTDAEFRAVVIVESNATVAQSVGQHLFINCDFGVTRTGTSATSKDTIAVRAAGRPMFIGCNFRSRATSASYTGNVRGLVSEGLLGSTPFYPGYSTVQGGSARCTTAGSGTAIDMFTSVSEAQIHVDGANYATASGNVYNDGPTAALNRSEIDANSTKLADILTDTGTTLDGKINTINTATGTTLPGLIGTPVVDLSADIAAKASQSSVNDIPTNAELATALDPLPTAAENASAILAAALSTGTVQQSLEYMRAAFASSGVFSGPALENAPSGGGGGTSQPRINRKPDPGFTTQVSRRSDGTYKCTKPIRLTAGNINQVYVFIDMSPLFGPDNFVQTVGTLSVSAGDIEEGDEKGPRDTYAVLELDGSADDCTCTVPVTMTSGTTVPVVFDVEVLGD